MDRWLSMRVFVQVAETAGFAAAGRTLGMSAPAVTRAVAALEAAIGAQLLTRTTRSVKLTDAGTRYLEDCRRILAEIAEAEAAAAGSYATATGVLTVTAPVQFGRIYVLPIITDYLALHPDVTVRAMFLDRLVNLVEEGSDIAVRIGRLSDSGLSALRVGAVRRVVCASPAYLARRGTPTKPADLREHAVIGSTSLSATPEWRFGRSPKVAVAVRPRLICNTVDAALAAAIDGHGLARLLSYQAAPAVADGRLAIVLEAHESDPLPIHLVHAAGRHAPAKVRAFLDLAVARLRADPMIDRPAANDRPGRA